MIPLLVFKELFGGFSNNGSVLRRILGLAVMILGLGCFVAVECLIYWRLYDTFAVYKDVNYSLTSIILLILFLGSLVYLTPKSSSIYFSLRDRSILSPLPVSVPICYIAKTISLYLKAVFFATVTILPLAICFGIKSGAVFTYYVLVILFPLFIAILSVALSSLLSIPFRQIAGLIKRNVWVMLVFSLALMLALSYAYSWILNLFVDVVAGNSIASFLSASNIDALKAVGSRLYPFVALLDGGVSGTVFDLLLIIILLPIGVYALVLPIIFPVFSRFMRKEPKSAAINKRDSFFRPLHSPTSALIRKEFLLLTNDSNGVFSFFPLTFASPFLLISVVIAVDSIFHLGNLNYMVSLYPGFTFFIEVSLVMLFLSVINGSASMGISKEGRSVMLMKQFPISLRKQLLIKILIPFVWSVAAFLASLLGLAFLGTLSWMACALLMITGILYLGAMYLASCLSQLTLKEKSTVLLPFLSFVFPFVLSGIPALACFIPSFSSIDLAPYLLMFGLSALVFASICIFFFARAEKTFISFEGGRQL